MLIVIPSILVMVSDDESHAINLPSAYYIG